MQATADPMTEHLGNHPLLRTGDLDEARAAVARKFCDHRLEIGSGGAPLRVRHNHAAGRSVSINY
ncbi:MAG: AraC family transcriptional regulator, partial [Pseudomonadota bacterium]